MKRKLVVIAGAGASYDYGGVPTVCGCPLADGLFADEFSPVMAEYPPVFAVAGYMKNAIARGSSVEEEMEKLVSRSGHLEAVAQTHATVYYIWDLMSRKSRSLAGVAGGNYDVLFTRIATDDVLDASVITFNYDTLIEQALHRVLIGASFDEIGSYQLNKIRLFKPHGSVSWAWKVQFPVSGDSKLHDHEGIARRFSYDHPDRLQHLIDHYGEFVVGRGAADNLSRGQRGELYYPALALPVKSKSQFACPDRHIEHMKKYLQEAETLLVIGWRASEENFGEILRECTAGRLIHIHIVDIAPEIAEASLRRLIPSAQFTLYSKKFSNFMVDDIDLFFESLSSTFNVSV